MSALPPELDILRIGIDALLSAKNRHLFHAAWGVILGGQLWVSAFRREAQE